MDRRRLGGRLLDLAAWAAIWAFGAFVGAWWAHHGDEVLSRLAVWSERPAAPGSIRPTAEQIEATQAAWRRRKAE